MDASLLAFVGLAVVIVAIPGPAVALVLTWALPRGWRPRWIEA